MSKKYELVRGKFGLYRIKALKSFEDVKAGDLGGLIEREHNLSHEGTCWVYAGARVFGDAKVSENAQVWGGATVYGNAWVCGDAQVFGHIQVQGNVEITGYVGVYDLKTLLPYLSPAHKVLYG
jgi:hypothetical protein